MATGLGNGNLAFVQQHLAGVDQFNLRAQQAASNGSSQLSLEEAKLLMHNRQLIAQLQNAQLQNAQLQNAQLQNAQLQNAQLQNAQLQNAQLQNAANGQAGYLHGNMKLNGMAQGQAAGLKAQNGYGNTNLSGLNLMQLVKASEAGLIPPSIGIQAAQLHNLQNQSAANAAAARMPNLAATSQALSTANQAALMQALAQNQGNPQYYGNMPINPYQQGNTIAAAALAATQQARAQQHAVAQQQARAAAAAMGNFLQTQQAVNGARANLSHQGQQSQASAASQAALLSTLQGANQVVFNGKNMMLQNNQAAHQAAAAAAYPQFLQQLQQLQAAAQQQQQQAKQLHAFNQLKQAIARGNAAKQAQAVLARDPAAAAAALKQLQAQEVLQARNGAIGAAQHMQNGLGGNNYQGIPAELLARVAAQGGAVAQPGKVQRNDLAQQAAITQALLQARAAGAVNPAGERNQLPPQLATAVAPGRSNNGATSATAPASADMLLASLQNKSLQIGNNQVADPAAPSSPSNSAAAGKEQRRLALARVALQLARVGVSVEQAINSGLMGGMSVTDVRFIVECYNAERERMKNTPAAGSQAGSDVDSVSSGVNNGSPQGSPPSGELGSDLLARGLLDEPASDAAIVMNSAGENDTPKTRSSPVGQADVNTLATSSEDAVNSASGAFDAFSYGFFGETDAEELLEELEPEVSSEDDAATLEPKPEEVDVLDIGKDEATWLEADGQFWGTDRSFVVGNDDLANRLANLDLGSGFFS